MGRKNKLDHLAGFNKALYTYKNKCAKGRGKEWKLEDWEAMTLFQSDCAYCGSGPTNTMAQFVIPFKYNGIDRIDNDGDYTIDNCLPCCKHCNKAKGTRTAREWVWWITSLSNNWLNKELPLKFNKEKDKWEKR